MSARIVWTISFVMVFAVGLATAQASTISDVVNNWSSGNNSSSNTWQFLMGQYQNVRRPYLVDGP